jgi:serine/threonine protein kinase
VTEFLRGGELLDRIRKKRKFCEREAAGYVKKLVAVVDFLHRQGVVHRDLKPEVEDTTFWAVWPLMTTPFMQ